VADLQLKLTAIANKPSELKLALKKNGAEVVPKPLRFTDTYYDTPDLKLRQRGLSLAVQEQGKHRVQILTSLGSAKSGLTEECRDPITTEKPDPLAPETGPRLRSIANGDLHPLFKIQMRRTRFKITGPSAEIAGTLDEGEIDSPDGGDARRVCELKLELKRGEANALYDLALQLLHATPLRIETQSPPERGYRLSGVAPEAVTAKPLALDRTMTVETALQSVGRECLGQLLYNEPAAIAGEAEGFHQMRVALRRLRSALSAVRPMLPPEQYRWLTEELKWLASSLGPARDWDVFASELVAPVRSVLLERANVERLADVAEQRRQIAYNAARKTIETRQYAETILKLARWFEARGWRDQQVSEHCAPLFASIADLAPSLIERHWRKTRRRSKDFGKLSQVERHKVRISLKKLRYTLEFLGELFDADAVSTMLKPVKRLQEDLGRLNDICTAQNLIKEITFSATDNTGEISQYAGMVLGWYIRGLRDAEATLYRNIRRFRKPKPFWRPVLHAVPKRDRLPWPMVG
jgi:triphosphatase